MKTSRPTYGSVAILNARAAKGSSASGWRVISFSSRGSLPLTAPTSTGDGRYATTPLRRRCTPLFLNAAPQKTGTITPSTVSRRNTRHKFILRYACMILEVTFKDGVIHFGTCFHELHPPLLSLLRHIIRYFLHGEVDQRILARPRT